MNIDLTATATLLPGLLFSLGIFILVTVLRRIVEGVYPKAKTQRIWSDAVVPTLPIFLGGLLALCWKTYPYPVPSPTASMRVLLGIVAGFTSSWAVRILKSFIKEKTGVDVDAVEEPVKEPAKKEESKDAPTDAPTEAKTE
jgi:hypothetical protein